MGNCGVTLRYVRDTDRGLRKCRRSPVCFSLGRSSSSNCATILLQDHVCFCDICHSISSIMCILGEDLASWMTPDPTLQRLIIELLPLVGIGNIALTAGSVSWALVGSQGRYRLATLVAFISSWCLTLPLAAIVVYCFNFNLEGPVSAVVIGYSATGTCLQYILVRSDWERLSKIVVERNGGIESDSSSDSSSSLDGDEQKEGVNV